MSRILVIDDQPHIRKIISELLVTDNHQVDQAEDGKVGLKLFNMTPYDLVITDVVMPERDGLEVLMSIRNRNLRTRIIVMSGGAAHLDVDNLLNTAKILGADRVIAKPIDFIQLQKTVKDVLNSPARTQAPQGLA
ncbi:MAG: response regulator [Desulfuromonadales bacterium]